MSETVVPTDNITSKSSVAVTYLWLATVPLTWGFNFVALKILYNTYHFTVAGLLSARYMLMVPVFASLLLITNRDWRIRREHWKHLGIFAFFTVGIYQYLFAKAIDWTSAGEAALIISSAPIFTFLITAILGYEKPTRVGFVGVTLGFAGIAMVIFGNAPSEAAQTHIWGDLVMLAAAILWSCYAIFSRPLLKHYSPLKLTAWAQILGSIMIIPIGFRQMAAVDWAHLPVLGWTWVLFFAWLAGVYGYVVWYRGVRVIGSSKTMLFQYVVPPVALVVAYLVLHEAPSMLQTLGVIVTLAGVNIASMARSPGTGKESKDEG